MADLFEEMPTDMCNVIMRELSSDTKRYLIAHEVNNSNAGAVSEMWRVLSTKDASEFIRLHETHSGTFYVRTQINVMGEPVCSRTVMPGSNLPANMYNVANKVKEMHSAQGGISGYQIAMKRMLARGMIR